MKSTWWRVLAGFGAGAGQLFANGAGWKQILASLALAGMGYVSHITSTSDATTADGVKKVTNY